MRLLRQDFAGDWLLERQITDHLAGQHGEMRGTVALRAQGNEGLVYDEAGTMTLESGVAMPATRRYLWAFSEASVDVAFADGKPFHSFVPEGAAVGTDHLCGADLYRVQYDFMRWPVWTAVWTVKGPRKDYASRSVFSR